MRTPIHPDQLAMTQDMLNRSANILATMCNMRLNLDPGTRDAINRARTELSEAERILLEQPIVQ